MGKIGILIGVIILVGVWVDARMIEPTRLTIQSIKLTSKQIKEPIRVVQLADIHLGNYYKGKKLEKAISKVNALQPDFIILSGDLVDDNRTFNGTTEAIACLSRLQANYGKFAVFGNHDYAYEGDSRYRLMMKESNFNLLVNTCKQVVLPKGSKINLIGLDDCISGNTNIELAFEESNEEDYNILIAHEPDIARDVVDRPIDLQLSGHSHGGQIRIPFIGAFYTPKYSKAYIKGLYTFEENPRMKLYVSSGIGTTILPYRFMNPPEIVMIDIIPDK